MIEPDHVDEKLAGGGSGPTICYVASAEWSSRVERVVWQKYFVPLGPLSLFNRETSDFATSMDETIFVTVTRSSSVAAELNSSSRMIA